MWLFEEKNVKSLYFWWHLFLMIFLNVVSYLHTDLVFQHWVHFGGPLWLSFHSGCQFAPWTPGAPFSRTCVPPVCESLRLHFFDLMLLSSWFIMIFEGFFNQANHKYTFSNQCQCGIVPSILNLYALKILSAPRLPPLPVVFLKLDQFTWPVIQ